MLIAADSDISYADKFGIDPSLYSDVEVTTLPFSVRVINCLMRSNIKCLSDLLSSSATTLSSIKGFGANCFAEIESYMSDLSSGKAKDFDRKKEPVPQLLKNYLREIETGDFSFVNSDAFPDHLRPTVDKYKDGYDILGKELVHESIYSPEKVLPIIQLFAKFTAGLAKHEHIKELVQNINASRRSNRIIPYISAFSVSDVERDTLYKYCKKPTATYNDFFTIDEYEDEKSYSLLIKFLKWSTFDVHSEIDALFSSLYPNERSRTVLSMRANKNTLEQIGTALGLTRERIRQIESKTKRKFAYLYSRSRIISKISAELNGATVLSPSDILDFTDEYGEELLFLLQSIDTSSFQYDQQLDVFIIGNDSISERISNYIETLPEIITISQYNEYKMVAEEEEEIPPDLFEKAFFDTYKSTGDIYHRSRLSRAKVYADILEKFYPNGIKAYDTHEIADFRKHIRDIYGNVDLPENDRALTARIAGICILCGRGVYRLKQSQYIPKELEKRIYDYINESEDAIFLSNTLFSVFEEELLAVGVSNKYYLQGILHEAFGDKFTFRRDYISKDPSITSVYSSIVNFIKRYEYPVSKMEIQKAFPGITEIVINFAVGDPEILNFFGVYLHASHLNISENEKEVLFNLLSEIVSDNDAHHGKEVFERISATNMNVFSRNAALSPFQSYSILEYLFRDDFQFSRPYVANHDVEIGRPGEILHDLIYSTEKFLVSDISDFCKENRYQIQSILEYVHECFDQYLLVDDNTLLKIDSIGISEQTAKEIDAFLADNITKTLPINQLDLWQSLPQLNVPWTDWLLYSILKKWGDKTIVATSNNQFRLAVPLIATPSCYNPEPFLNMTRSTSVSSFRVDDLDNIDKLLEDIIDEDFLEDFK